MKKPVPIQVRVFLLPGAYCLEKKRYLLLLCTSDRTKADTNQIYLLLMRYTLKHLLSLLTFLLFTGTLFSQEKSGQIQFYGVILNNTTDTIRVFNHADQLTASLPVMENKTFGGKFQAAAGYYKLLIGREQTPMYLTPGDDIQLEVNSDDFDRSIIYKGKGSAENNYLAKKFLNGEAIKQSGPPMGVLSFDETSFLNYNDSIFKLKYDFLTSTPGLSGAFMKIEKTYIDIEKINELVNFPLMKTMYGGQPDFKVSPQYPDVYKLVDFSNADLIQIPAFSMVAQNMMFKVANEKVQRKEGTDVFTVTLHVIDSLVPNAAVKEYLTWQFGRQALEYTKTPEAFYESFKKVVKNKEYLAGVSEIYEGMSATLPGKPSPDFKLMDINGKEYTLSNFRGKYVYIDVWATWCNPCMAEVPHLKKLESELHGKNIEFVSICSFDTKDKWQRVVKEKELGGVQLFAEKDITFLKMFQVRGIPRFILLDPSGKIVSGNAERPSDPALRTTLGQLGIL